MSDSAEDERKRSQRTILLLIGGAVSLALPLAAVAYLRYKDSHAPAVKAGMAFERRQGEALQPLPTASAAPALPPGTQTNSLGFIQAGEGMRDANAPIEEKPRTALQQAAQQAGMGANDGVGLAPGGAPPAGDQQAAQQQAAMQSPPQAPPQTAAASKTASRVPFQAPRLQTDKSFGTQFGGQKPQPSGGFKTMSGAPSRAGGQQGMGGGGMPGGMPGGAPGGAPPDMNAMMQQMQQSGQQLPPQYQQMMQQATQKK